MFTEVINQVTSRAISLDFPERQYWKIKKHLREEEAEHVISSRGFIVLIGINGPIGFL